MAFMEIQRFTDKINIPITASEFHMETERHLGSYNTIVSRNLLVYLVGFGFFSI